jgi:hypothetical protein
MHAFTNKRYKDRLLTLFIDNVIEMQVQQQKRTYLQRRLPYHRTTYWKVFNNYLIISTSYQTSFKESHLTRAFNIPTKTMKSAVTSISIIKIISLYETYQICICKHRPDINPIQNAHNKEIPYRH